MKETPSSSSSSFPANYVTLKDLQERWIKRKQDEENEDKLRRIKEEEEEIKRKRDEENEERLRRLKEKEEQIKSHSKKESKNHQPKSKNPHSQRREPKEKNQVKNPIDAKSESSKAIAGRRRAEKLRSGRSRIPPSQSESAVEIGDKREKKEEEGLVDAREDRVAEICRKVEDISVVAGGDRRGGRIGRGGGFRRGGGTARVSDSGAGMVWVRKTTEG